MARFRADESDKYGGSGNGSFFSLKNHKDTAQVRFMYNTMEDVEGDAVHQIELNGKNRYVNCLRAYDEPLDACPLCAERYKVIAKIFVPVYDIDADEVKIWDRGKKFIDKLSSLCARHSPLVATPFEVERNGKAGDTNTTYETYALEADDTTLEDLPEMPVILGGLVLDKTYEELEYYLDNGDFPRDGAEEPAPAGRNPASDRRTPAPSRGEATGRQPAAPAARGGRRDTPARAAAPETNDTSSRPAAGGANRKRRGSGDKAPF